MKYEETHGQLDKLQRKCKHCGEKFFPSSSKQMACSQCQGNSWRIKKRVIKERGWFGDFEAHVKAGRAGGIQSAINRQKKALKQP